MPAVLFSLNSARSHFIRNSAYQLQMRFVSTPTNLNQQSSQTVAEAVEELRKLEATQDATTTFAPSLLEDIEQHDDIHVVFGWKFWPIFGLSGNRHVC